jgi:serine/threonine protein kinase
LETVLIDANREAYLQTVEGRPALDGRFEKPVRLGPTGGNGNFSLLFKAFDRTMGTEVVLKFFHPDERHDAYRWACFDREARILLELVGQKDIIQIVAPRSEFIATFVAGPVTMKVPFAYYALERAEVDLAEIINADGLTAEEILKAFGQMCRALQRIHKRNIVHRDLKPRNFLVLPSGEVKLSDFGTARAVSTGSRLAYEYHGPPGDLRYAALELLAGLHDEDPAIAIGADLFAMGAILFEFFTGTTLSSFVYTPSLVSDLRFLTRVTKKGERREAFDAIIGNIANAHPLPRLRALGVKLPSCILPMVEELYQSLAALDHRRRLLDFERIFLRISSCLLVLRNEKRLTEWRQEKQKRRIALKERQRGFKVRI